MISIKHVIRKILFGKKASSEYYLTFLKNKGAVIGDGVKIYSPNHTYIDELWPFMLTIGNNVNITSGVHILNHDYSWSVIKAKTGTLIGGVGPVNIGNNVFIGVGSIILMNTYIGNNCIVGAGSVVSGHFPDNSVIAGNPAKIICSLDAFMEKRKKRQYDEAKTIVCSYRKIFNQNPPKELLSAYIFLFEPRSKTLNQTFINRLKLTGNYEESLELFLNSSPEFDNYENFLESIE